MLEFGLEFEPIIESLEFNYVLRCIFLLNAKVFVYIFPSKRLNEFGCNLERIPREGLGKLHYLGFISTRISYKYLLTIKCRVVHNLFFWWLVWRRCSCSSCFRLTIFVSGNVIVTIFSFKYYYCSIYVYHMGLCSYNWQIKIIDLIWYYKTKSS